MYVCIYVHTHKCYIYIYIYIHIHVYIHICIYIYIYVYIHIYIYICNYTHTYMICTHVIQGAASAIPGARWWSPTVGRPRARRLGGPPRGARRALADAVRATSEAPLGRRPPRPPAWAPAKRVLGPTGTKSFSSRQLFRMCLNCEVLKGMSPWRTRYPFS